jgi:hypothetical protein
MNSIPHIASAPWCSSFYGADVMLKRNVMKMQGSNQSTICVEPVLLEMNFMPDCIRACRGE